MDLHGKMCEGAWYQLSIIGELCGLAIWHVVIGWLMTIVYLRHFIKLYLLSHLEAFNYWLPASS
jgi:hypothetical protein